jgi:hypothetical protein
MRAIRLGSCIAVFSSVALAGVAAAGCSSSSGASAGASPSATASPSPTGVAAKVLTPKDLPGGWSVDATPPEAGTGNVDCPLLNSSLWSASTAERGEADMSQTLAGPYLVETISIGTSAQADTAWKAISDGVSHCTTYTHTGAAGSSTFTITKTDLPSYGDSSYAFTLDVNISGGVHATGNIVAARSGNSVLVIYLAGVNGVPKSVVENVVSTAVAKAHT